MATVSKIEWTEVTWNPVTGCSKVSAGCKHCYAERMAGRLQAMGMERYRDGFDVTLQPDLVELPLRWRKPRVVFVDSMSDLFHEAIPDEYIHRIFSTMVQAEQHTFQVLTKRSKRLATMAKSLPWPENVWMGVSVESPKMKRRVADLVRVPAAVRFLSMEPLLEAVPRLALSGIDWVIVGGESGPRARPLQKDWVRQVRDRYVAADVAFFFKQGGGTKKAQAGRRLDGRLWSQMPTPRTRSKPRLRVLGTAMPTELPPTASTVEPWRAVGP